MTTWFILASGPSLTKQQCEAVRGHKRIAINTTFRMAPRADVLYACDGAWWDHYIEEARRDFHGVMWTQDLGAHKRHGINLMPSVKGQGLCKESWRIHQGKNGGYQAIGLAYQFGAKRIILLGYDMRGGHWHGNHPQPLHKSTPFAEWLPLFVPLADDLQKAGVEVVNCTPGSALDAFPKAALEDVL